MKHTAQRLFPRWEIWLLISAAFLLLQSVVTRIAFAFSTGLHDKLNADGWYNALWHGLRYDAGAVGILLILALLLTYVVFRLHASRNVLKFMLLILPCVVLYLSQIGDLLYARESGRHISYELVELIDSADSLSGMLLLYWMYYLPLPLLIFIATRLPFPIAEKNKWFYRFPEPIILFLLLPLAVATRGGVSGLPMSPNDVQELGDEPISLTAMNGAYSVFYAALHQHRARTIPTMPNLAADAEQQLFQSLYTQARSTAPQKLQANVILLFLESWPAEYMKSYGYHEDVTPNFDALRKKSLTTTAMFAGGHRTVEGVFSTLCSYQNPEGFSLPLTHLFTRNYRCLPQLLHEQGYTTRFFQGMHWNSAKLGAMVKKLGFEEVQGKESITHELQYTTNNWGVHDADLYHHVLEQRRAIPEPHFIALNTTTTHDETIPANVSPQFGFGNSQEILRSLQHFADQQLQGFIDQLDQQALRLPTILIVVADHTARVNSSPLNSYRIPFLIYAPDIITPQHLDIAAAQRDIAPTVLDILGLPYQTLSGQSLLRSPEKTITDFHYAGRLGWIENDVLIDFRVSDLGDTRCYDWRKDVLMQQPLPCTSEDFAAQQRALAFKRRSTRLLFEGKTTELMDVVKRP